MYKRKYQIVHETLVLEVDVERHTIVGYAELLVLPLTRTLRTIGINCKQLTVREVLVNEVAAEYSVQLSTTHYDSPTLSPSSSSSRPTRPTRPIVKDEHKTQSQSGERLGLERVRNLQNWELDLNAKQDIADFGELQIQVPESVRQSVMARERERKLEQETHPDVFSLQSKDQKSIEDLLPCLVVRVNYELSSPKAGVQFVGTRCAFVSSSLSDASLWFPCVDGCDERCTFDLQITVPASLTVVASGSLVATRFADDDKKFQTFVYKVKVPVTPAYVGFAAAPFESLTDPEDDTVTHYGCVRGVLASQSSRSSQPLERSTFLQQLKHTTQCTSTILHVYEKYLGQSLPFDSYKQVFVDEAYNESGVAFAGLSVFDRSILCGPDVIEQTFESWTEQAWCLAYSWLGTTIRLQSHADQWILLGLAGYLKYLYVQEAFGHNEAEYHRLLDIKYVAKIAADNGTSQDLQEDDAKEFQDVQEAKKDKRASEPYAPYAPNAVGSRPLHWNGYGHRSELHSLDRVKKAAVVIKMLETLIGPATFKELFKLILNHYGESAVTEQPSRGRLCTRQLIEHAIQLSNVSDLHEFAEQWIYTNGCPQLECEISYNKKKSAVLLHLTKSALGLKFAGNVKVVIHEESMTFDYTKRIDDNARQTFEFPCRTKMRRNHKRKYVGDENELPLSERLKREAESPVLWVRIDPQLLWFSPAKTRYADEIMWLNQLHEDKNVISQLSTIENMSAWPPAKQSHLLTQGLRDVLQDERFYYRVRLQAASGLAQQAQRMKSDEPMNVLLDTFKTYYYEADRRRLRHNDFADFTDYFLKRDIPDALLAYVDPRTKCTPQPIALLLLELLKNNDNSRNKYSDAHYLAALLSCLSRIILPPILPPSEAKDSDHQLDVDDDDPRWHELRRYLHLDQVLPSYRNLVTAAALESVCQLELSAKKWLSKVNYLDFTRCDHVRGVRMAAFRCLVRLSAVRPEWFPKLFTVLEAETVPGVRTQMATFWADHYAHLALEHLRAPTAENRECMNRLWKLLNKSTDPVLAHQLARVYGILYGFNHTPVCASQEQDTLGQRMCKMTSTLGRNSKRRNVARRKLQEHRVKRYGGAGMTTMFGPVKVNEAASKVAVQDGHADQSEAMDCEEQVDYL